VLGCGSGSIVSKEATTVSSLHQGFQETGQTARTEAVFRWLDGADENPLIQQVKRQMLDTCPVAAGDQVLDVGCGLGHEVRRLAKQVGPRGRVVGIDANAALIAEARRRGAGLTLPVSFEVGDAHQAGLPDDSFDLCRTERVLRYVARPEAVLGEMVRLTRRGGSVLAFDFDSDQTVVDASDPVLLGRIAEVLDAAVPHPWVGRRLFGLFQRAGLRDVRVVPHALCLSGAAGFAVYQRLSRGTIDQAVDAGQVSAGEVAAWWAGLERAAEEGTFFSAVLGFIVAGRKA
jgi:ubiquinone/menaquinone biosynthesis C-methylase UbiE